MIKPATPPDEARPCRRRFRFTVRRLMVAVAIAAVIGIPLERRGRFLRLAAYHRASAWRGTVPAIDANGREAGRRFVVSPDPSWRWHFKLSNKYAGAAARPWLPVAPDSPVSPYWDD